MSSCYLSVPSKIRQEEGLAKNIRALPFYKDLSNDTIFIYEKTSVGDPWHFGADPYLWQMDPDPAPVSTPFFIDLKDAKKFIFFTSSSVKKLIFLLKFCVKLLFFRHYSSPLNTFMRKGKDPDPDPYLWPMDPDLVGPKKCGSCGSGSPTLENTIF